MTIPGPTSRTTRERLPFAQAHGRSGRMALVALIVLLGGCGDDASGGDAGGNLVAFCEAIERSEDNNPFGAASREPDLDMFLAGLEEMSAAYKDAIANAPSEIKDDFDVFASEATQRYDTALAIDNPTDQTVDAVIFGGIGGGASDLLLTFINTECGIDL